MVRRRQVLLSLMLAVGIVCRSAGAGTGAPQSLLRVLVQPPAGVFSEFTPEARANQCVGLYLYDWFAHAPGVRLVDEAQARFVLGELRNPALISPPDGLYAGVNGFVAVDAVVVWRWAEGTLRLELHRSGGVKTEPIPWAAGGAVPKAVQDVTAVLATELGVDERATPVARGLSVDVPQWLEDYYLTQRLRALWMDNSGAMQLNRLRPYLTRLPQDPWLAEAIIRSGTAMSTDTRAVDKPDGFIFMVQQALPCLLGTTREPVALAFVRANRHLPEAVEKNLLAMIAKAGGDAVESALEQPPTDGVLDAAVKDAAGGGHPVGAWGGAETVLQKAGVLRCLGALESTAALPHLERIAKAPEPELRRAVASALGEYPASAGAAVLAALTRDPDSRTAFSAVHALWRRGEASPELLRRAADVYAHDPACDEAFEVLAREGDATVVPHLTAVLDAAAAPDGETPRRRLAADGLRRLGALSGARLTAALADPDGDVVRVALGGLTSEALGANRERVLALANHPDPTIAEAARLAVAALLPAEPGARRRMELAIEHPYIRRQIVLALATNASPEARADLLEATRNPDAHTRAVALRVLAQVQPEIARGELPRLLRDAHRLVRLRAAVAAATLAGAAERPVLEAALAGEKDEAARLYLQDALARATAGAVPVARPAANRVPLEPSRSFQCGLPQARSSFDGFYVLGMPPAARGEEPWRQAAEAQAAGKIVLVRANGTAKNPAQVFLNSGWRDGFWLGLDAEFEGHWGAIDGVILGEESMYFRPEVEWANGWRLFCREAGIDASRVAGRYEALTELEQRAWGDWYQRVAIEGFNAMVEYIRLRYGKLHPGLQVGTFMPEQNRPCDYDAQWDFDFSGAYYYACPSRTRYATIRRLKTTWPTRPVIYLNQGKVGVGISLNEGGVQHTTPVPKTLLHNLYEISSADAITTWLAGAHNGLFAVYGFARVDAKEMDMARSVGFDDITPTGRTFADALDFAFAGLDEKYRVTAEIKALRPSADMLAPPGDDDLRLEDATPKADAHAERASKEKQAFRAGFLFERKLIEDTFHLLAGVSFPPHRHEVLLVGPRAMRAPGFDLANDFDCLVLINQLSEKDLRSYRFLGFTDQEAAPLREATIAAVTTWLRETPGLLYVNGWVEAGNTNRAARVGEPMGALAADWPWEAALQPVFHTVRERNRDKAVIVGYDVKTPAATVLREQNGHAALVFWTGAGLKGAVVFGTVAVAPEELRAVFNRLHQEKQIGVAFEGPIGMQGVATAAYRAMSTCKSAAGAPYRLNGGVDVLSGVRDPELAKTRVGVLCPVNLRGTYLAAANGVAVLGDQPLTDVTEVPGGLKVKGGGLLRVVSESGRVRVSASETLPPVAEKDLAEWLYVTERAGQVRLEGGSPTGRVVLVRAPAGVSLVNGDER